MRLASLFFVLGSGVLGGAVVSACGSTSSNGSNAADGSGGSGGTSSSAGGSGGGTSASGGSSSASGGSGGTGGNAPASAECGGMTCEGLSFGLPDLQNADACCPEGDDEPACGLDTTPLEDFEFTIPTACQPRNSPGELDEDCPESPPLSFSNISFMFPGCCLPTGKCGYMLDSVAGIIPVGLGCIDATEFLEDQEEPPDCTPADGAGGEGGAGD